MRHEKGPSHRKDSNLSAEKGKRRSKQKERKAHHIGRAYTHEPSLSRIRAPVDSETAIVVNESKAREKEEAKSTAFKERDSLFLEQARCYQNKILAEAEKEEEKEERTATITSLDELQLRPLVNEGIERPAKGSTAEFQDYETKSWD
nr:hypothetical protein [Tanacetum cinerariifolium]